MQQVVGCARTEESVKIPEVARIVLRREGLLFRLKNAVTGRLKESKVKPDRTKETIVVALCQVLSLLYAKRRLDLFESD